MRTETLLSEETEQRVERARVRYLRVVTALVLVTAVTLGWAVLTLLAATRELVALNATADRQRAELVALNELVVECVTPPEKRFPPVDKPKPSDCYTRNNARTGEVVGQIGNLSIIAASCGAAHPGDVPATRRCTEKVLSGR
jgi:hypothetical protein